MHSVHPSARLVALAQALIDAVSFDDCGIIVGGQMQGGNGGLLSRETIKAADALRQKLERLGAEGRRDD